VSPFPATRLTYRVGVSVLQVQRECRVVEEMFEWQGWSALHQWSGARAHLPQQLNQLPPPG
jgi:hypothetical protein